MAAAAQAPPTSAIARQLESTDARIVAWGAYNAAAYHRDDMIPRLQEIVESPPATALNEERDLIGVVMDALIQLNARVPARALVRYVDKRPVHTFVLLSSATDRERVLLELLPRLSGLRWFAAADMLFTDRAPELTAHLVNTVRLQLIVDVADTGDGEWGTGSESGVAVGCGIGQDAPGYPPHAEYRFELGPRSGFFVLATGPHPVYYSRRVTRRLQYAVSQADVTGPTDEDRVAYLQAMLPHTGGNPLRAKTEVTVHWSTTDALIARVSQLRADVERRFRNLVDLARHYYPFPVGVTVEPPIDVRLADRRRSQTTALPPIR